MVTRASDTRSIRLGRLRLTARIFGWMAIIASIIVIVVAWWLRVEVVASLLPGSVTMKANVALGVMFAGSATVAIADKRPRWLVDLLGALVFAIGIITVLEYLLDIPWSGFDELIAPEFANATDTASPGRMGLNTAINFSLIGAGIITHTRRIMLSRSLTVAAGIVAYLAFIGYVLDVPRLSGFTGATQMAITTAMAQIGIVAALTFLQPPELIATDSLGGAIARRFLPGTLIGVTALVSFARWTLAETLEDPLFAVQVTVVLVIVAAMIATAAIARRVNRLSEDLRVAEHQLRAANDELSRFAAVAAHDLRAPLRKIGVFLERTRSSFSRDEGPRALEYLSRAEATTNRMYDLLEDILALGQVDRSEKRVETVPIKAVVDQVVDDFADRGSRDAVQTTALPTLEADPSQMYLLFANLISNSLKYAHPDRPPQIVVSGHSLGDGLHEITVTDNGMGFDPTVASRLFEPFERGSTGALEGSGIGLAVCRRIVETHGGSIRADSAEGMGSTFTVRLPSRQRGTPSDRK
ncbi:MAG: hypothetical protein HKN46_08250 [Acidimicrobiia bacterium]|nr:hypothetical protein [Acidimicrobiia bacterium]